MAYNYPQSPTRPVKDTTIAYALWFLLGGFGGHKFYLGQTNRAIIYILLTVVGSLLTFILIGYALLAVWFILWVMDAFALAANVRKYNQGMLN